MKTYHVSWEIEVEATNPRAAALRAQIIQRDPESTANVFTVKEFESKEEAVEIDLDAHTKRILADSEIVLAIQELLDGVEWNPDTMSEIALLLVKNGYRVRDCNDVDHQEDE